MKAESAKGRAALRYARRGWPVLSVYEIKGAACACGAADCTSPFNQTREESMRAAAKLNTPAEQILDLLNNVRAASNGLSALFAGQPC